MINWLRNKTMARAPRRYHPRSQGLFFPQENEENIRSLPFSYVRRRLTGAQSRVSSDSYVVTPRNIRRPVQYHPNIYSTNYRAKQPSPGPNTITENKNNGTKTNLRQDKTNVLKRHLYFILRLSHISYCWHNELI